MKNKKPPDKYTTIKCPIKQILKNKDDNKIVFDAVDRMNQLVIHTYQFLRLWILYKYENKKDIPPITKSTIMMSFIVLLKGKTTKKPSPENLSIYNEFLQFYNDHYKQLGYDDKIDRKYLTQIRDFSAVDILTNIENNIKLNFLSYVRRFINKSFKQIFDDIITNTELGKKTAIKKELQNDLLLIKNDIFENTLKSKTQYHKWIELHRPHILPEEYKDTYEFDISQNPQKYIKYMIYMCQHLEKLELKSFQFFPLRTSIIPKHIQLDTTTLIDLFLENKNEYRKKVSEVKNDVWNKVFNLNDPVFKMKSYTFDYSIRTDCFTVSLQFIHNSFVEKEKQKKEANQNLIKSSNMITKNMSPEEKSKYKITKKAEQKDKNEEYKLKKKKEKDERRKEFKLLPKEEQIKIISDKHKSPYPYLEDLNEAEIEHLRNSNIVYVDPGKRCLLYMKGSNGRRLRYTNRRYLKKIRRLKYQKRLDRYRKENQITETEELLNKVNSKSCFYKKFKEYIDVKNKVNKLLAEKYKNEIFRKYKWYGYLNKKKSETELVKEIKRKFGKDVIMIYGDWSIGKAMQNFISTPNLGLKRKLSEHFIIYSIDEFRTSKIRTMKYTELLDLEKEYINIELSNEEKTEVSNDKPTKKIGKKKKPIMDIDDKKIMENNKKRLKLEERYKVENLNLPDKLKKMRKIHSILTYKMENNRIGCINRDENAIRNMEVISKFFIEGKGRPEIFSRPKNIIKGSNLTNNANVKSNHVSNDTIMGIPVVDSNHFHND